MPLFVLTAIDRPNSLPLRLAERSAHLAYLAGQSAMIKVAGPLLDDAGAMIGSLFILEAADAAAVVAFSAADPFTLAGLFAQVEVRAWRLGIGGFA